jgi:2-polyprenyl-3-methyl-5-hydroxy-6-metoxy-1,4-benzoquinol methylase
MGDRGGFSPSGTCHLETHRCCETRQVGYEFRKRLTCPVCETRGNTTVVDLAFDVNPIRGYLIAFYGGAIDPDALAAGRYTLVDCSSCGLLYQRDVPGDQLLSKLYDDATGVDRNAGRQHPGFDARRGYAIQVEQMMKYFSVQHVEVLDYGMGWGTWLQMAQAFGCRAVGAELSSARVDAALPGIEVVPADDLPRSQFHFVNTEQVFEHLIEPRETAKRLVASLRPGGILRISVPNGGSVRRLLEDPDWNARKGSSRSLNAIAPLEHVNCFTHRTIMDLARGLGLQPFTYPIQQFLDPSERLRFVASSIAHAVRQPKGTMLLFQKP